MKTLEESIARLRSIRENNSPDNVKHTAQQLEGKHYYPLLLFPVEGFFYIDHSGMEKELRNLFADPEVNDDFSDKQSNLLLSHYELITRLRWNDPNAWDTIMELVEDD